MSETPFDPYAPPKAPLATYVPSPRAKKLATIRNVTFCVGVLVPLTGIFSWGLLLLSLPVGGLLILISVVLDALVTAEPNARGLVPFGPAWVSPIALFFGGGAIHLGASFGAGFLGTLLGNGFHRGRQVRSAGKTLLPAVGPGEAWCNSPNSLASTVPQDLRPALTVPQDLRPALTVPQDLRPALAQQWRENGRTEHASVGAFATLALDLLALGAPPKLLADANRDALDEIRHAELCFGLARSLDGAEKSPEALVVPPRTSPQRREEKLAALAIDSLFDGALHEGLSARVLAKLAKRCEVPSICAVIRTLAQDEGRHAAHAWDVLDFCLAEGGPFVADALEAAAERLPTTFASGLPEAAKDGSWERWGIHGSALEAAEYQATLAHLHDTLTARLQTARKVAA